MDDRLEVICGAALDAIRRGEPAPAATIIDIGSSTSHEIAVSVPLGVIAVRRSGG
jgi:hypothetical protein